VTSNPSSLLKSMNSRPDRNVRPTFFNDPEASSGADISVCAFFNRLIGATLAINSAKMGTQKHECVLRSENASSRGVFFTTSRKAIPEASQSEPTTIAPRLAPQNPLKNFEILPHNAPTDELGLAQFGLSCTRVERVLLDERLNAARQVHDKIHKNTLTSNLKRL